MFDPKLKYTIELENLVNAELDKIGAATETTALKITKGFGEAGTAVTSVQKCFEDLNKVQGGLEEKVFQVEERFKTFSSSAKELAESVNELNSALNVTPSAQTDEIGKTDTSGGEEEGGLGALWFLKKDTKEDKEKESDFEKARNEYVQRYDEWAEQLSDKQKKRAKDEFTALDGYNTLHEKSIQSRANVQNKAYSAMETQLLRFVESNRFSAKEFGKAVAQQVKMELLGLAARSAVWAIFETAMGLKDLAMPGMQPFAAFHFKSAAQFAAVSGAALAGSMMVQKLAFGGPDKGASSGSGGGAGAAASMTVPCPY